MFVRQSKYDKTKLDLEYERHQKEFYREAYSRLLYKWNSLVESVNRAGGEAVLKKTKPKPNDQFSEEDIRRLLQLCHPDKHDGKQSAVEMTQKLNRMRK